MTPLVSAGIKKLWTYKIIRSPKAYELIISCQFILVIIWANALRCSEHHLSRFWSAPQQQAVPPPPQIQHKCFLPSDYFRYRYESLWTPPYLSGGNLVNYRTVPTSPPKKTMLPIASKLRDWIISFATDPFMHRMLPLRGLNSGNATIRSTTF
jgi:hypothetical protein